MAHSNNNSGWGYSPDTTVSSGNGMQKSSAPKSMQDTRIESLIRDSLRLPAGIPLPPDLIEDIANSIPRGSSPTDVARVVGDVNMALAQLAFDPNATIAVGGPAAAAVEAAREHIKEASGGFHQAAMGGMMAALGGGATAAVAGGALSTGSLRKFAGLTQDTQMTIAEEGRALAEKAGDPKEVSMAMLGNLTPNINTGQQRDRGQGASLMA